MIHIHRLAVLSLWRNPSFFPLLFPFAYSLCYSLWVPFTYLESLLLCGTILSTLVSLPIPSPFPPHSNFPTPRGVPKSIVRPTKTTSRTRLHIVRNIYISAVVRTRLLGRPTCLDKYRTISGQFPWSAYVATNFQTVTRSSANDSLCSITTLSQVQIHTPSQFFEKKNSMYGKCMLYIRGGWT